MLSIKTVMNAGQELYNAIDSPVHRTVGDIVNTIVALLMWVVIVAAIIFLILNALKFVTSQGDAGKAQEAQKGITYAIIGIVVAVLGKIVVQFVLVQIGVEGIQ